MKNNLSGWIILDKPSGITSAHAVAKVKRLLKPSKIGHAGTLDSLASGILPLALGEATKTVAYMMDARKSYAFTVTWGQERDTDDCMGQVVRESEQRPTLAEIETVLPQFTGVISQIPPDYSAIKIDGQRAYDAARGGNALELKAREVRVEQLAVSSWQIADVHQPISPSANCHLLTASFICHCGKGTYIRSLARDMGRVLGCFGYISELRRLSVGNFDESHAISLEVMEKMLHKGDLSFLRPVESALDDIPACDVSHDQAVLLRQGQKPPLPPQVAEEPSGTKIMVRSGGNLVGICEVSQGSLKPVRVFNL